MRAVILGLTLLAALTVVESKHKHRSHPHRVLEEEPFNSERIVTLQELQYRENALKNIITAALNEQARWATRFPYHANTHAIMASNMMRKLYLREEDEMIEANTAISQANEGRLTDGRQIQREIARLAMIVHDQGYDASEEGRRPLEEINYCDSNIDFIRRKSDTMPFSTTKSREAEWVVLESKVDRTNHRKPAAGRHKLGFGHEMHSIVAAIRFAVHYKLWAEPGGEEREFQNLIDLATTIASTKLGPPKKFDTSGIGAKMKKGEFMEAVKVFHQRLSQGFTPESLSATYRDEYSNYNPQTVNLTPFPERIYEEAYESSCTRMEIIHKVAEAADFANFYGNRLPQAENLLTESKTEWSSTGISTTSTDRDTAADFVCCIIGLFAEFFVYGGLKHNLETTPDPQTTQSLKEEFLYFLKGQKGFMELIVYDKFVDAGVTDFNMEPYIKFFADWEMKVNAETEFTSISDGEKVLRTPKCHKQLDNSCPAIFDPTKLHA